MPKITIIDYDAGNLRNVQKAVEACGYSAITSRLAEEVESSDVLILPGVGAFQNGMGALERLGLCDAIRKHVITEKKPILGICLGMQLFAKEGHEGGRCQGLGFLPMVIEKLPVEEHGLRLPHIGWNSVDIKSSARMFDGVSPGPDFYFVHSFHAVCETEDIVAATCSYGQSFVASVERDNIFATQFHPEKSQRYGLQYLRNFLEYSKDRINERIEGGN